MSVIKTLYDTMPDGREVFQYKIENNNGVFVELLTRGATLASFVCPDRDGVMGDILVGFDTLQGHLATTTYAGEIIGQYANRICDGKFTLDGTQYQVTQNENGVTCLHGGGEYNSALWRAIITDDNAVEFSYHSPDGAEGFPGNVDITVLYVLNDHNELEIHYTATTDKKTIVNFTNHAYFNLGTMAGGDVLDHELQLFCDFFTPTDAQSIPTGELRPVAGTAFDFRTAKKIGRDIGTDDVQLVQCRGYDHNFCVSGESGKLRPVAKVSDEKSGRKLEVFSDLPGVQLYTGNFLDGSETGKGGIPLQKHAGFCLETQYYPDTPNQPDFPSCVLEPGKTFKSLTIFKV